MPLKIQTQIYAQSSNPADIAQEVLDGFYFERLITYTKAVDNGDSTAIEAQEFLTTYAGRPTLIDYESEKKLGELIAGDKIIINGFAISFGGSYTFEHPVEFIIPEDFVRQQHAPKRLFDLDQQVKIDNLRQAINKLRDYGEMLAKDKSQPLNIRRAKEFVFDQEIEIKVRKGVEAVLLANQLNKKLNHFLLENPNPSPDANVNFVRAMKATLHEKDQLFATHRDEATLIIRDILLVLTVIAPIIWTGKAIHSFLTNGHYSLFKNNTETQKNIDHIEDKLLNL